MNKYGPLQDVKIVELAAQGPGPFAGAMLADLGADVVIVDRDPASGWQPDVPRAFDFYNRNKRSIALDLKSAEGLAAARELIAQADIFIEGYRPGVAERLGLGPEVLLALNPRLVYGRMTGWGQTGPMAQEPGHDLNYAALSGALAAIGEEGRPPPPPLNLVADLGGGAMFLVMGLLAALREAERSGQGQVVDCAMIEGVANLMSMFQAFRQQGSWSDRREDNVADGGAPHFRTYETADGKYIAVGAVEDKFYRNFIEALGLDPAALPPREDRANWPALRARFAEAIGRRSRAEWEAAFEGRETCTSPVLTMDEAWAHPQMRARGSYAQLGGLTHPKPAPRLSRTPGNLRRPPPEPDADRAEILRDWGLDPATGRS